MRQSWASEVIDRLAVLKSCGLTFEEAWARSMFDCPPRGREFGAAVRSLTDVAEDEEWGEPFDQFLKRITRDAWTGEKKILKHLGADLAGGFASEDQSGFAVKNGRMTNRAAA